MKSGSTWNSAAALAAPPRETLHSLKRPVPDGNAIAGTVLAHREITDSGPFDDADYSNAYGPTVHFPVARNQVDTWAKNGNSETDNAFYKSIGAADLARSRRVTQSAYEPSRTMNGPARTRSVAEHFRAFEGGLGALAFDSRLGIQRFQRAAMIRKSHSTRSICSLIARTTDLDIAWVIDGRLVISEAKGTLRNFVNVKSDQLIEIARIVRPDAMCSRLRTRCDCDA